MAKISSEQLSDVYKTMLEQESFNHNIFITVLLAIVVILLGATWWFNKNGASKTIKKEVERVISEKVSELSTEQQNFLEKKIRDEILGYEKRIKATEANVARSLAISARQSGYFNYSVFWYAQFLEKMLDIGNQEFTQKSLMWMIRSIEELERLEDAEREENQLLSIDYVRTVHKGKEILRILNKVPDFLKLEREKLIESIAKRLDSNDSKD